MGIEMLLVFLGTVLVAGMLIAGTYAYERIRIDGYEVRKVEPEPEPVAPQPHEAPALALVAADRDVGTRLQLHVLTEQAVADRFLASPTVESLYQSNPHAIAN